MKIKFYLIFLFCVYAKTSLFGQENNEEYNVEKFEQLANRYEWVPTLLNANSNPVFNMVMYNGRIFSWNIRGEQNAVTVVDGISWQTALKKWRPGDLFAGLHSEFYNNAMVVNGTMSEYGYAQSANVHYVVTEAPETKKSLVVATGFSNTIYTHQIRVHYNSGLIYNNWYTNTGIIIQQSPSGLIPNGYKKSVGLVHSINKQINDNSKFGFSLLWNIGDQGKSSTTVNETYMLTGMRTYNPNWGWYHKQLYFPSTKQTNAPIFSVRYQKKWNELSTIQYSVAIVVGKQSQSSLEWTKTADPRPDYYRYLPSYIADSAMRNKLTDWYIQHPEQLQINFDHLEKINLSSADKRSFYIVNQQNSNLFLLHGSILFSHFFKFNFNTQMGVDYAFDRIHYYNTIKDLLGGNYFYNYNSWINDDGLEMSFQNDIEHPNKKIKKGELWGANYTMLNYTARPWIQFNKTGPVFESGLALGYGMQGIQRIGYNANGLFPISSKGKSNLLAFPSWDLRGQLLYKLSGRTYFRSIVYGQWMAPLSEDIYVDQDINALTQPYLRTELHNGADISFFYRAPLIKLSLSAYWKSRLNHTEQKMFYHDGYAAFVYGLVGKMNSINNGMEAAVEANLRQDIQVNFVSTYEQNEFSNNPEYQLLLVNNLTNIASGLLHLKSLSVTNSPALVNAITLQVQPMVSTRLGLTMVYAQQRPIAVDFFRRSDQVKNKIDAISWSHLVASTFLPNEGVLNAFLSKSFQIKRRDKQLKWTSSLSVRNLLNAFIPVIAYEQSRFDYVHFNTNKYAPKYMLDQGVSYALRLQLQIQ